MPDLAIIASSQRGAVHLFLAVSNSYRYQTNGKTMASRDYENLVSLADSIYGHTRVRLPFTLTAIGY